ncbi:MAG: trypsin-like peptidase domain-containing protein [Dehalococcoidia bacterium]|nr:trypsin-like peptidase domain-containing protein [Dehalococcoidia bacterium]
MFENENEQQNSNENVRENFQNKLPDQTMEQPLIEQVVTEQPVSEQSFSEPPFTDQLVTEGSAYAVCQDNAPSDQYFNTSLWSSPDGIYSSEAVTEMPSASSRKPSRLKFALALVSVCILCSSAAGFGGMFLAYNILGQDTQPALAGSNGNTGQTTVDKINHSEPPLSIAEVAALTKDSVVEISTEVVTTYGRFGSFVSSGAGSGVIVSNDGYIVTNEHVISGASKISVYVHDVEYTASLIASSKTDDLAILKIEASGLAPAVFGSSDSLIVGETVVAIGNPLGKLGGTVTSGIISALNREISVDGQIMTLLQTDASVNPGNSGGGLFNLYGELVGIVNAKSTGSDVEGLGFAIPINSALDYIQSTITADIAK